MAAVVSPLSPRSVPIHIDGYISQHLDHDFNGGPSPSRDQYLEVSFYLEREHQLNLETVDTPNRLLALALTQLKPLDEKYATTPYDSVFNWAEVMDRLRELAVKEKFLWRKQEFYVVEFRSKLKSDIDRPLLFKLDKESHREATQSGGLLKYWYGSPDFDRRNLATCKYELWKEASI